MKTRTIFILLVLLGQVTVLYPQTTARERIEQRRQQARQASEIPAIRGNQQDGNWEEEISNARWSRIIYRYIDLTKEANEPLYHPITPTAGKSNLFTLIFRLLQEDRIRAYEYLDGREEFTEAYRVDFPELVGRFGIYHESSNGTITVNDADVPSNEVLGYYLKEAYYFDSATSSLRVRPLALCPILFRQEEVASADTRYPLFWIPYSELEPYTRRMPLMASSLNNRIADSVDDFFRKRSYDGEIYKTGNPGNRAISQYTSTPEEMKAEQQRIEQELLDFEQLIRKEGEVIASPPREAGRRANRKSSAFATILIAGMTDILFLPYPVVFETE
ncbi:MAG: gliding motility protein GldN [Proteiniphilum sp.]|nr:gliding motility protein GldN [Proteiniphilum sp.]